MDIKSKIFKRKAGKAKDKWIVRIEYFDEILGKTRCMERQADRRSDVVDIGYKLADDLKKSRGQIHTGERMTFSDLADICEKNFYQPATIVEGKKIAGLRSPNTAQWNISILKKFFGKRLIRQITTESLTNYKLWRLEQGSQQPSALKSEKKRPIKLNDEVLEGGSIELFEVW